MAIKTMLIEYDDSKGDVMGGYPLCAPAVEVVRCRDCSHYTEDEMEYYRYCGKWCGQVEPNGFCAWSERRA